MQIISWNVNGLRANVKKGGFEWLLQQDADIFCLQETKAHPDQLEEGVRSPANYLAYFDHSKLKKGYSGVAVYLKKGSKLGLPSKIEYGLGVDRLDQEGRFLGLFFDKALIGNATAPTKLLFANIYFPNGGGGPERLDYKLCYYDAFLEYINKYKKEGYEVIFCGDVNTAHTEIDLARPKANEDNTGFLPVERAWIDQVVSCGYIDIYREQNPKKIEAYTYWDMKTFARDRNVGWRIDYFFVTPGIAKKVKKANIMNAIFGSDHCPIDLTF
ncbi:MAG: Exodeoxyribonuclease [Candidatus Taylorbacteria bacterium]|nr:Exodeoxyribonuclease [Candidatus Taylorbacteria bacterium]